MTTSFPLPELEYCMLPPVPPLGLGHALPVRQGGLLPPAWYNVETARGAKAEGPDAASAAPIFRVEVQLPRDWPGHKLRLKPLSLKPSKDLAVVRTVEVLVEAAAATKKSATDRAGYPPALGAAGTAASSSAEPFTSEQARAALGSALFAVDAKLTAACGKVEARLGEALGGQGRRLAGVEASVGALWAAVEALGAQQDRVLAALRAELRAELRAKLKAEPTAELRAELRAERGQEAEQQPQELALAALPAAAAGGVQPPVAEWGEGEVAGWLASLGLAHHAESLALAGARTGGGLLALTADDLAAEELGIDEAEQRSLEAALDALRPFPRGTFVVPSEPC